MATAPISYGSDYASDQAGIDRARQYAALMQQQSMEQQPTQVVNGWAVPQGKSAGISKVVQALTGAIGTRLADQKQKDLTEKYQKDLQDTLSEAQKAYTGTPAVPGRTEAPLTPNDDEGNPNSPVQFQGQAAVAGDPMRYAQILMRHPATQQLGLQAAQQAMQRQQWAQLLGVDGAGGTPAAGPAPSVGDAPMPGATGAAPAAPGGPMPASGGSPLANTGIDQKTAQMLLLGDPTGKSLAEAVAKARTTLFQPHVSADGKVVQYQQMPDGSMGWGPGKGAVGTYQQYQNVQTPQQIIENNLKGAEYYDKTGRDLPGFSQGKPQGGGIPQGGGMPPQPGIPGMPQGAPQPPINPQLAGLPPQIAKAIQADMARTGTQNANFRIGPMDAPAGTPVAPQNIQTGQIGPQGPMPQQSPVPIAPGVAPSNQRASDAKMADELNQLAAKDVFDGSKTAQKAVEQLSAINESRKAIAGGAFQGTGAGAKTDIVKAAKGLFGIDLDPVKASNSDYLRSTLGSQVLAQAKALGTNPSNTDAKRIEEIVGNLDKDPSAMNQLLDWQEQMIRKSVSNHNSNVDQMERRGYKPPYDLRVTLPDAYVPPASAQAPQSPQRRASDNVKVKRFNPATGKIE